MAPHSGEMVKAAMRAKGMTQVELAKRIGKDQTLISRYMSGQIEVSADTARSMAEVLEIDFEKLRRQLQRDKYKHRKENLEMEFRDVIPLRDKVDIQVIHGVGSATVEEMTDIPLLDSIPSGLQDQWREKAEKCFLPPGVQVDTEKAFALKVSGENMTDGKIDEGDIIVVDPSAEVRDGARVLVVLNGEPALRKIYRSGKTVALQSQRNHEGPITFLSQKDDFEIVGRVVFLMAEIH